MALFIDMKENIKGKHAFIANNLIFPKKWKASVIAVGNKTTFSLKLVY